MAVGYAIDYINGEYLCPCTNNAGENSHYSQFTGQIYCDICPDVPSLYKAWNSYDGQGYCVCTDDLPED